jgi:cell division GTPase FtsZ
VNILLLSTGGGGGNIVRSLKALFHRDVTVTQKVDAKYAERLRAAVTPCCLDTNEFSLSDLPDEERLLIGSRTTGRLGARHNPDVARQALEESRGEVEALIGRHSVIILIGTGGKGTGAGTLFPLAQMARQQRKLVIPIFVRPSFERHEVDKRRYDHALKVSQQFDAAKIRLMEILNDCGYTDADPRPQAAVWERMNLPIARGLRGLIYVLWDLSQVDPSDLSSLFAGDGRLRIGFGEIDPPAGQEPTDEQVERAVRACWENPYYAFGKPAGTSLICIQGDWSNVVDARIKGRLAASAMSGATDSPYTPLYARAAQSPRPWGVTALLAEHTGTHPPLEIDWALEERVVPAPGARGPVIELATVNEPRESIGAVSTTVEPPIVEPPIVEQPQRQESSPGSSFSSLWEFAVALNRSDPAALAVASNGARGGIPVEGLEVKRLLGTMWFRGVVPKLSREWKTRILEALVASVEVPNHGVKLGRRAVHLSELSYGELQELTHARLPDVVRPDLELLTTVGRLWGGDAIGQFRFTDHSQTGEPSRLVSLLHGFRS